MAKNKSSGHNRRRRTRSLRRRFGDNCYICGVPMDFVDRVGQLAATINHVKPRCQGGSDALHNLKLAHRFCNESRAVEAGLAKIGNEKARVR